MRSVGRMAVCRRVVVALTLVIGAASWLGASSESLKAGDRREVVELIGLLLRDHYVDAEAAERIAAELQSSLEHGTYDRFEAPLDFAGQLTSELQEHDRHFLVDWSPPGGDVQAVTAPHSEEATKRWADQSRRRNFGFEEVARLPGNVGYLDLRYFDSVSRAGDTAAAAMAFVANSDALIVDLRQNGGGEPEMVQLLVSYFLGPEPVHYNSLYWRGTDSTVELWSLADVPGRRLLDTPLYILTGARTGSAAEGFSYALQALGRATIVGQATAGAANPGEGFDIAHGFSMFISTGKAVSPITGGNWEGTGVRPDLEVPTEAARVEAHLVALGRLRAAGLDDDRDREISWATEALEIERNSEPPSRETLEQYVGTYGARRIRLEGDLLTYQRGRRQRHRMVFAGDDRFLLEAVSGFRLRFERDASGRIVRLVDMWVDGHQEVSLRESS